MLIKILVTLSASFLLSSAVGLLLGRAISTFRDMAAPPIAPPSETDEGAAAANELEDEETLVPMHAHSEARVPLRKKIMMHF